MAGRHDLRARLVSAWAIVAIFALTGLPVPAAAGTANSTTIAYFGAQRIALRDVAQFHCHDRDYPVVRCFLTPDERMSEEAIVAAAEGPGVAPVGTAFLNPYVRWYRDADFAGPSYEAYYAVPNLAAIGWDNLISSFTPLNGGHPLWWTGANQTGNKWDWGTAAVGNLGSANDQFSSVVKP